jgi:endonuclease/exonuclease/phosphatase family metal-dependent hydrolase
MLLYAILFLFFFQILTDFIAAVYAFGLLGTSIPPQLAFILLLFTPALLIPVRKALSVWWIPALGLLFIAARLLEVMLATEGRMIVAGLGTGLFLLLFPLLLWRVARGDAPSSAGVTLGVGLALGVAMAMLARVAGSGVDVTTDGRFQAIGWLLALIAALLLWVYMDNWRFRERIRYAGRGRIIGLCVGIMAVFTLYYFSLIAPNVVARWTGANYLQVVGLAAGMIAALTLLGAFQPGLWSMISWKLLLGWNLLFALLLAQTILGNQLHFPALFADYPIPAHTITVVDTVLLMGFLLLSPVLIVDVMWLIQGLVDARPSLRGLGAGFTLGALFLLVMTLAHIFTTVYDYIPLIGPFFRDKFWLVYLVASVGVIGPLLLLRDQRLKAARVPWSVAGGLAAIAILIVSLARITAAAPAIPPQDGTVTILTYNIQQGYDEAGQENLSGQLALMQEVDADIIGLQESDTNRIAIGNRDVVRAYADALDLYSYYGPKVVNGTFGIALLSRYPIEEPRTYYMASEGEQTAVIVARITVDGTRYAVFVTHLGNGGPRIQLENVLTLVEEAMEADEEKVILMGDFNFRPGSEQYQLATGGLVDAWSLRWPDGDPNQAIDPADRIDHVFLSPGIDVLESTYITEPESDHPALVTEINQ